MGRFRSTIAPLLLTGLLIGGCSQKESSKEDSELVEKVSTPEKGSSSLKNRWWEKEPKRQQDYVENFADMNIKMIWVPASEVKYVWKGRGVSEEIPLKGVSEGVWMQETEFTIDQYIKILELARSYDPKKDTYKEEGGFPENVRNPDIPITEISYLNAKFIADYLTARTRKGYRLPDLLEWSAAVESSYKLPVGEFTKNSANLRWLKEGNEGLRSARGMEPNKRGFYGLVGNAGEFVHLSKEVKKMYSHKEDYEGPEGEIIGISPSLSSPPEWMSLGGEGFIFDVPSRGYYNRKVISPVVGFRLVRDPELDLDQN